MPWRYRSVLDARLEFVNRVKEGRRGVAETARECGVRRQTAHRWRKRYDLEGEKGLRDRSKAPRVIPHKTPDEMEERVLQLRRQYPTWGGEEDPGLADLSGAWSDVACGRHDGRDSGSCGDGDSAEERYGPGGLPSEARLDGVLVAQYRYDDLGRRVERITGEGAWYYGYLPDANRLVRVREPTGRDWMVVDVEGHLGFGPMAGAYTYAGGDPVLRVDPDGRLLEWVALGAVSVGLAVLYGIGRLAHGQNARQVQEANDAASRGPGRRHPTMMRISRRIPRLEWATGLVLLAVACGGGHLSPPGDALEDGSDGMAYDHSRDPGKDKGRGDPARLQWPEARLVVPGARTPALAIAGGTVPWRPQTHPSSTFGGFPCWPGSRPGASRWPGPRRGPWP